MNAFVACAKVTFSTVVATVVSFMAFCTIWTVSLYLGLTDITVRGLLYLNEITTVCIGLAAGWFVARHYRIRPYLIAAVAATLVEALHASASGAFRGDAAWRTVATLAIAAAIAVAVTALLMRLLPEPKVGARPPAPADLLAGD